MRIHHNHVNFTSIDFYAERSGLGGINPGLKCFFTALTLILVLAANSFGVTVFVTVSLCAITVCVGKTPLWLYFRLLLLPLTFVLISGLALVFDYSATPIGIFNLPFFGGYFCATTATLLGTAHVTANAIASISALYTLSLSTPIADIIPVLRKIKVPEIIIELMYLIYRYIFVLSHTMAQLRTAADCRLGFFGWRTRMRSTAGIMTALLLRSFQRASTAYDAMESRCYTGTLRFLETPRPVRTRHLLWLLAWMCVVILLFLTERAWL